MTRQCVDKWKCHPEFQQRVAETAADIGEAIKDRGIADLQNRIDALNERWNLMRKVIETRAVQYAGVPCGDTGLLVCRSRLAKTTGQRSRARRQIAAGQLALWEDGVEWEGSAEDAAAAEVGEYVVGVGLLRELREHEKQAAQELGQWKANRPDEPAVLIQEYIGVPLDEV